MTGSDTEKFSGKSSGEAPGKSAEKSEGKSTGDRGDAIAARRAWLAVLARASVAELEAAWDRLTEKPRYRLLRPTETGLTMVRGRIGGSGAPFNLGEMTMTRAAVQLIAPGHPDIVGFGHVAGRQTRRAELVAVFDALLQDPTRHAAIDAVVVTPLSGQQAAARAALAARVAPSKVDFLTVVRGE